MVLAGIGVCYSNAMPIEMMQVFFDFVVLAIYVRVFDNSYVMQDVFQLRYVF